MMDNAHSQYVDDEGELIQVPVPGPMPVPTPGLVVESVRLTSGVNAYLMMDQYNIRHVLILYLPHFNDI